MRKYIKLLSCSFLESFLIGLILQKGGFMFLSTQAHFINNLPCNHHLCEKEPKVAGVLLLIVFISAGKMLCFCSFSRI